MKKELSTVKNEKLAIVAVVAVCSSVKYLLERFCLGSVICDACSQNVVKCLDFKSAFANSVIQWIN